MPSSTEILIVGAGLAGLRLASQLEERAIPYRLIEARDRFGGRIKTHLVGEGYFDMGPAWFWDGQPRIHALIERLGLEIFEQYAEGAQSYEDENGTVHRGVGASMMIGSKRLIGGLAGLIDAMVAQLPNHKLATKTVLERVEFDGAHVQAFVTQDGRQEVITAGHIVLCVPPRVATQKIKFQPPLPLQTVHAMDNIATWMAGQAKAVAVYDQPFWRTAGLSGDAMSRAGPMVEIHDASPHRGGPYGLFGFIGIPAESRRDEQKLRHAVLQQFGRLFGAEALKPRQLYLKDWALDSNTTAPLDLKPVYAHPDYKLPRAMQGLCDGRLLFGSTEVAPRFGGYLEGALEAADSVAHSIEQTRQESSAHAPKAIA